MLLWAFYSEPPECGAGMSFIGVGKQRKRYFALKNAIIEKQNSICMEELSKHSGVLKDIPECFITEERTFAIFVDCYSYCPFGAN